MYFSTRAIDRANRRDAWRTAISNLCGTFVMELGSGDIDGTIDVRKVGMLEGMRICQPSGKVYRTAQEIRRGVPTLYVIILQLAGHSEIELGGRVASMSPGNVTVIDSTVPSSFRCDRKSSYFALHVPKDLLNGRGVNWDAHLASICPAPTASLMHSLVLSSFERSRSLGPMQSQATGDAIINLFTAGYLDSGDDASRSETAFVVPNLHKSIHAYIITHLHDETLSPGAIALAHHISERQLHRLFEPLGLSVCRCIRQARLDRCAMVLRDRTQSGRTITEIAFSHGFSDSAHFSRAFRDEFHVTPREYRTRSTGALVPATEGLLFRPFQQSATAFDQLGATADPAMIPGP